MLRGDIVVGPRPARMLSVRLLLGLVLGFILGAGSVVLQGGGDEPGRHCECWPTGAEVLP